MGMIWDHDDLPVEKLALERAAKKLVNGEAVPKKITRPGYD